MTKMESTLKALSSGQWCYAYQHGIDGASLLQLVREGKVETFVEPCHRRTMYRLDLREYLALSS